MENYSAFIEQLNQFRHVAKDVLNDIKDFAEVFEEPLKPKQHQPSQQSASPKPQQTFTTRDANQNIEETLVFMREDLIVITLLVIMVGVVICCLISHLAKSIQRLSQRPIHVFVSTPTSNLPQVFAQVAAKDLPTATATAA